MAGIFENHDRARFETVAVSLCGGRWRQHAPAAAHATSSWILPARRPCRRQDVARNGNRHRHRPGRFHRRLAHRHPGAAARAAAGQLSGFSLHHGRALRRLSDHRPHRHSRSRALCGKNRLDAGHFFSCRSSAGAERPANAPGVRAAGKRFRLLRLQQQLQNHAGHFRSLDAAAAEGGGQRAVAAADESRRPGQSARGRRVATPHRRRTAGFRARRGRARGSFRPPATGGYFPGYALLQCPQHGGGRAVVRRSGRLPGPAFAGAGGGEPVARGGTG